MATIFDANFGRGCFQDFKTETLPTNTDVTIHNTEKGRAAYFNGSASLDYGDLSVLDFGTGNFSVAFSVRFDTTDIFRTVLIKKGTTWASPGFGIIVHANRLYACVGTAAISQAFSSKNYHHWILERNGSTMNLYQDNALWLTSTSSAIADDVDNSESLMIGYRGGWGYFQGPVLGVKFVNTILTSAERADLYTEFSSAQTQREQAHKNKAIVEGSADADVLFFDTGLNWNADGVTQSLYVADYRIGSGSFRVREDTTGKYIECVTNGAMLYEGVDLSGPAGNGYISKLTGDLSGDQGGTIAAASAVAWAGNVLSLTMTAGQVYREMMVTRGA